MLLGELLLLLWKLLLWELLLWVLLGELLLLLLVVGELKLHVLHRHLWLRWRSNFNICENPVDKLDVRSVVCHEETPVGVTVCYHRLMGNHGINSARIAWRRRRSRQR